MWLWFQHDGLPARYGENSQRCLNRHVREGELVVEGWLHGLRRPLDLNTMAPPLPPMETSGEHVNPVCSKNIDYTVTRFRTAVTTDCADVLWRISRGMLTVHCLLITNGLGLLEYLLYSWPQLDHNLIISYLTPFDGDVVSRKLSVSRHMLCRMTHLFLNEKSYNVELVREFRFTLRKGF